MKIIWRRTRIGGEELPHDFCADVENVTIARIYRNKDSNGVTVWSVNMQIGDAATDSCLTRREAIEWVEHRFAHFLTTEAGKRDPQEWPHDQRTIELRSMRQNNPEQYAVLVEDLRSGRVERIARKR